MRPKTSDLDKSAMNSTERAFHNSLRPSWAPDGTLVYAMPSTLASRTGKKSTHKDGLILDRRGLIASESKDIRFAGFIYSEDVRLAHIPLPKFLLMNTSPPQMLLKSKRNLLIYLPKTKSPMRKLRKK